MTPLDQAAKEHVDGLVRLCREQMRMDGLAVVDAARLAEIDPANLRLILEGRHRPTSVSLFKLCFALGVSAQ